MYVSSYPGASYDRQFFFFAIKLFRFAFRVTTTGVNVRNKKVLILNHCMAPMFLSTVVHVIPCIALLCRSTLLSHIFRYIKTDQVVTPFTYSIENTTQPNFSCSNLMVEYSKFDYVTSIERSC